MADRRPLVLSDGLLQQLQSGDVLVDSAGAGFTTATALAAALADYYTAAEVDSSIDTALEDYYSATEVDSLLTDVVEAVDTFSADNQILRADGTGRGAQSSTATIGDDGTLTVTAGGTTDGGNPQSALTVLDSTGTETVAIYADHASKRNIFIGRQVGLVSTTGANNLGLGDNALRDLTTGSGNLCIGTDAGREIEAATGSLCFGTRAGRDIVGANNNICIGTDAGRGTTGASNIAIGLFTVASTAGNFNIAIGRQAGINQTSGNGNVWIGDTAARAAEGQVDGVANSIAIGSSAVTTASNQAVLGASTITQTTLRGIVEIVRGNNACALRVHERSDEYLEIDHDSNVSRVLTKQTGSGTASDLALGTNNMVRLRIAADGTIHLSGASLPTSDPGVPGQLWLNSGVLQVSP